VILAPLLAEPPLTPTPDEAREALRRELLKAEYHDTNLLSRFVKWLGHAVDRTQAAASGSSLLTTLATMIVLLVLVAGIGWLVARTRRSPGTHDREGGVLTAEVVTAAQLRRRAEAALAAGRYGEALVEAFRALTLRQVERGRLDDIPGATAHEVALALESTYPMHSDRVDTSAALFDAVRYGGRAANAAQAGEVLALDDDLAGAR